VLTGSGVRQYRRAIGLGQVAFARHLGVTQPTLSMLEGGRITVSQDHVDRLKAAFPSPKFHPSFEDFLRELERGAALQQAALTTCASHHSTLTVWAWTEGFDLSRPPGPELAADLITVRGLSRPAVAVQMPGKSSWWQKGEVIVFERCRPEDVREGEVCLVQLRVGDSRSSRTLIAIARLGPAKRRKALRLEPTSPSGPMVEPVAESLLAILRAVYRARHLQRD